MFPEIRREKGVFVGISHQFGGVFFVFVLFVLVTVTGHTQPRRGRAIHSRAASPTDSRATAATASQLTPLPTARTATAPPTARPRAVSQAPDTPLSRYRGFFRGVPPSFPLPA